MSRKILLAKAWSRYASLTRRFPTALGLVQNDSSWNRFEGASCIARFAFSSTRVALARQKDGWERVASDAAAVLHCTRHDPASPRPRSRSRRAHEGPALRPTGPSARRLAARTGKHARARPTGRHAGDRRTSTRDAGHSRERSALPGHSRVIHFHAATCASTKSATRSMRT